MASKGYLSTSVFHVRPGKEQEFTTLWQNSICKVAEKSGCKRPAMYHKPNSPIFMTTGHWQNEQAFNSFFSSPEAKPLIEKALALCQKTQPERMIYEIVEERAA